MSRITFGALHAAETALQPAAFQAIGIVGIALPSVKACETRPLNHCDQLADAIETGLVNAQVLPQDSQLLPRLTSCGEIIANGGMQNYLDMALAKPPAKDYQQRFLGLPRCRQPPLCRGLRFIRDARILRRQWIC